MGYETVTVDPGSNPSVPVAVDQVAGQEIQIVKLDIGADGASTPLGSLSNGMPVDQKTLAPGAATATNQATIAANQVAIVARQDTGNTSLASIDSKLPASPATAGNQATANTSLASIDGKVNLTLSALRDALLGAGSKTLSDVVTALGSLTVTVSSEVEIKNDAGNPVPVSVSSLPLPASAATAANQLAGNTSLGNIDSSTSAPTTVLNGKKTVITAGIRVALAVSTPAKSVTIKALAANTGTIYVGDSSVSSANGFALQAGETVSMDIANLNTVNLDSSANGEGVTYIGVS